MDVLINSKNLLIIHPNKVIIMIFCKNKTFWMKYLKNQNALLKFNNILSSNWTLFNNNNKKYATPDINLFQIKIK